MDMKKTAKKIAALVAGTTMLGATIMGAAADLSAYPAPFVADGVFSGKIVVGEKAATSDVVGAIDLAASLQAEAVSSMEIDVPGAAGEASVSGDAAEFRTGSDVVSFGEAVGTVKETFTASDLAALKSGVLDTGLSSTPVKQYLKFDDTTMYVKYDEDPDTDAVGDFLYVPSDSTLFEYHVEFTEGAESELDSSTYDLTDLQSEVVTLLGAPFTIVDADLGSTTSNQVTITFLGGQVADVLRDGETKTYTIDGKDYEVTAVFISDGGSAKLSVNGVMTKELTEGKTQVLGSDVTIGVQSVLTNQREGLVEFYLGANKVKMQDSDFNDGSYSADESVEVRGESVSDAQLIIKMTNMSGTNKKLNYIKYKVSDDEEIYIPAGAGVRAALGDNSKALLTDTWDITYAGMVQTASAEVKLNVVSDHSLELEFENINGDSMTVPVLSKRSGTFKWGDNDDDLIFIEGSVANTTDSKWENKSTTISDNDYFIVSDRATSTTETKAVTKALRYTSLNSGDNTVTFKDLSGGGDIVVSYTGTVGSDASGDLIVDGATHLFYIGHADTTGEEDYALAMDLDANGSVDTRANQTIHVVANGGLIIDLGAETFDASGPTTPPSGVNITLRTTADKFDESGSAEVSGVWVNESATANEVAIGTVFLGGVVSSLVEDPDDTDYDNGYTNYGAKFTKYKDDYVKVDYPLTQRYPQVFVTAGTVEVSQGALGEGGALTSESVNPIAVGLAVLDTEAPAVGSTNLIVVGGPCANTVAAELLGNPANCAEGFTPGKAVIKLFSSKNALLVAGYSAQDTLGATYVLADHEDYDLSGNEVEVVVADLNTISVNPVE